LLIDLLGMDHSHAGDDGRHHLLIDAFGFRWYRVGGLDYLLKRSDIDAPATKNK
jgi:maltose alpha-D-glucosyltransferase/alpha-amylase